MIGINHLSMKFSLDLNRYSCLSVCPSVCLPVCLLYDSPYNNNNNNNKIIITIIIIIIVSYLILPISLCTAFGTLMDDDVLVLPLDMLQYDRHKPSVDEVLSRFKQV